MRQKQGKLSVAEYYRDGISATHPKPVFRKGMPKNLFISAWNGIELFVEHDGKYRVSTGEEWTAVKRTIAVDQVLPKPRLSPFPRKNKIT